MSQPLHFSNIKASELADLLAQSKITLVDVRNADEVARGVIAGSVHLPLHLLPLKYKSLPTTLPIVFYCHSGVRSAHAADFLVSKGFENVHNLTGGILAWGQAGYALTSQKP